MEHSNYLNKNNNKEIRLKYTNLYRSMSVEMCGTKEIRVRRKKFSKQTKFANKQNNVQGLLMLTFGAAMLDFKLRVTDVPLGSDFRGPS